MQHVVQELKSKHIEGLETLLDLWPELTDGKETDSDGDTILHLAVWLKNAEAVRVILQRSNACIGLRNKKLHTPLGVSIINGEVAITKVLIEFGASLESNNLQSNQPALMCAISNENTETVRYLVEELKVDVNAPDVQMHGMTPLFMLIKDKKPEDLEIAKILLDAGASITDTPELSKFCVMIATAGKGFTELLRLMSNYPGWALNARDPKEQLSMLAIAANNDNVETCDFLLSRPDIEVNFPNNDGLTPLMLAAHNHNFTIMGLLSTVGEADWELKNANGQTAKQIAKKPRQGQDMKKRELLKMLAKMLSSDDETES
jgi:ankyrin repeat protein